LTSTTRIIAFEAGCNLGDPDANLIMGDLHLNGQHGYDMDFDLAREYYERAAEMGQPAAHGLTVKAARPAAGRQILMVEMHCSGAVTCAGRLGAMYANGWGVEPHNDTARRYFLKGVDLVRSPWYGLWTCKGSY